MSEQQPDIVQRLRSRPATTPADQSLLADAADTIIELRAELSRLQAGGQGVEPVRPDILERLTYHQLERDDLSLDDCLDYLAGGWEKVHGRTERQMVMQILSLLAGQPAAPALVPLEPFKNLAERLNQIGGCTDGGCMVIKPKGMHTNGGCRCLTDRMTAQRVAYTYQRFVKEITDALGINGLTVGDGGANGV